MAKREAINRKLYAGNPYVRFDEGEDALAATSRRGPLLYKSIFSSCLRKTIILISFCFTSTVIFGDIIQSGAFSPIEFNMVFEGENSEKSVSAVAKSFYSYSKIGSTVSIRRINHSQAWGFVMEKGDAVDVEFNITSGGAYGLNVYCVPKNYNQLNSALPNENVWPTEIRKYTTGTNMGDTKSFKIEVSCISEYEGSKTYVVTKNGNERARFTVAGGQFFIVAFLDEGGATNHDYNLGYTIRVKKTSNPTATPTPFPPQMVFASQGDYPDKILIGWGSMSEGYDSPLYKVYRSESFSGTKILIGETSESTYEDTTAVYGKTYYYWIKGVNGDKESEYSTWEADGWLGEPNLWTVSFNANGGSGSMSSQTFSNGTSQALKANTFTRSGYEFIGWATSSSGSVVYSDQQSISLSANKTLYAVWKVIDGAFDLVFGNLVSKNWKQGFFLNNTSNDVSVMHSFLLGETIYRNFFFANTGNEILKDEFSVLHEVLNSDGTVRRSYTQFSNYEYAQNYGRYWANNPWESGLGNLPVGSYIYRCTIDSENVIPESNESNNVFEYSFSIIDASHEDSLLEALGIGKFAVTVGGDAEWFAQKDVTHDGVSAVQSGDISDNQTSWMEVVVKNVSSVSFWWKVSSESGWDKLHFYVDGTEVVEPISGESDWIKVEHALTTDSHTLKWVYTKDGSVSNGDDCGWVDSVVLMPVRGKVQLWAGGPYWATTNVGAENPEDYGYYFWWGDTVGYKRKNDCWVASNGSSYDFSFVSSNVPTYGKDTATLQSEGWITSDGVLAPEHDAANVHWGNGWRMPTYQELEDLKNNCDWTYTTVNGVNGFVVCGKGNYSANSIFLPCAGYSIGTSLDFAGWDGTIASSVPCSDISAEEDAYNRAWKLYFMGAGIDYYHMNKGSRDCGHSVRAVQNVTCLTVTFDTCGGSSVDSVSIPLGQTLGELPIPTRDGYIFLGWFTAAEGGEQVTESTVVTGNMTLYAQWGLVESLTVSESLVAADASGKSGLVSITANCGWTVSKNVSWIAVSPTSGSGNGMISYTIAANTTAQSRSGTITVTSSGGITRTIAVSQEGLPMYEVAFNSNGGTLSGGATRNIVSGAEIGTLPTPTRDGYTFLGWFTAAEGGTKISASTKVTDDVTYYAHWIAIPCTIIFNANGGTVSPSTSTVTSGFAVGTLPTPTRSGYTFDGWYTSSSGGAKVSSSTIVTSNVTYYAHWIRNSSVPNPTPTPTPEPVPELGEGDYEVGGEMSDTSIPENAASVYDGYVYSGNKVVGTIQAKVAKPKNDIAKVTAAIQIAGEKKVSVKGELYVELGWLEAVAKDGRELYLEFGFDGMKGTFGAYEIDGVRNFFSSKDKDEKSAAEEMLGPYLGGYSMICDGGILSVTIAKKGKVTVKGTYNGEKVSAKAQALIGEEMICIPVIYSKKSANLAFTIWLQIDGGNAEIIGLDDAVIGKAGTLKNGARFIVEGDIGDYIETEDERTLELLPNGEIVTVSGSKWLVADGIKPAKVAYKKGEFTITEGWKGAGIANPSGLKLTYKSKDGSFKGSFTAYGIVKGKLKKHKASVEGVLVNGVGYGTITIKKIGTWAVTIK